MKFRQSFRSAATFVFVLWSNFPDVFAAESLKQPEQSEQETWNKIVSSRSALDRAMAVDTTTLSLENLAAARKQAVDQASQLYKLASDFSHEFLLSTNLLRAFELGAYALGVEGVLKRQTALAGVVKNVTGVEWESQLIKNTPALNGQGKTIRGAIETNLVSGAIAALRFRPTNSVVFSTLLELAQKATSAAGKTLARELITNSSLPSVWVNSAKNILNRQYWIGQPFDIKLTAIDGRKVDLENMRGKVVLVNFWATTCAPCIVELPEFKSIYERYQDRGFEIVGVSLDDETKPAIKVLREHEIPWPNILDDRESINGLAMRCGIFGIPNNWLVDRRGTLREVAARENIEKKVEALLAEPH